MRCHVCLEPYEPYEGHGKLCAPCRAEIDMQTERMHSRGEHLVAGETLDMRPWREYLRAFDAFLAGDNAARRKMTAELGEMYRRNGVTPPAHRTDLNPSVESRTFSADDPDGSRPTVVGSASRLFGGTRLRGRDRDRSERVVR